MDPVTHGIAGALIGKAFFARQDRSANRSTQAKGRASTARVAILSATLGAVFPDIDIFVDAFSHDALAIARYHRGFTHSFVGVPIFAVVLATLTRVFFARYPKGPGRGEWTPPSFAFLSVIYATGIASHIILDGFTSFGTRMLNPFSNDRVAWDLLFIVDFVLSALVLVPQLAAWVHKRRENAGVRATVTWVFLTASTFAVWGLERAVGFPFARRAALVASAIFAALLFVPIWRGVGTRISRRGWCRAGFYVSCAYITACGFAHHAAMSRVRAFTARHRIAVENIAAIPLPPSLFHWNGLILTRDGVYESIFCLRDSWPPRFEFWPDSAQNRYTLAAAKFEPVRTYLWYARFPVTHFTVTNGTNVVWYTDLRFFTGNEHPMPFTFYVSLDSDGKMLNYGWMRLGPKFSRSPMPSDNRQ